MVDGGFPEPATEARGTPPRAVRHVIAIAGGRGGAGASVVAINLAVYLAQLGRKVTLIDADASGAQLHTMLGLTLDLASRVDDPEDDLSTVVTPIPGLSLVPQLYSVGSTSPIRPGRKPRWARGIRQLGTDYVLVDVGAGTAPATLDLCLGADLVLCITTPEPTSVEGTYRFARAISQRRIRQTFVKDRFKIRLVERALAELPPLPAPQELVRTLARYDTTVGELSATELGKLRLRLIVNGVRLRADADLGAFMSDMGLRYLGVSFDYVGAVEHDDAAWLSVIRRRPLLIDSPTSKSARNIERIARRVLALAESREQEHPTRVPIVPDEPSLYDVLFTHRSATDEELRRAYKRQREIYQPGSLPLTSLLADNELVAELSRVEEANETLLDPLRRRAYDMSMFPEEEHQREPRNAAVDAAIEAERAMLREELAREINAETEFTGALLKKVRESQGAELDDIALRTKISLAHLQAIEAEDFPNLPAFVYTRGFIQEIAKFLRLDPAQVSRTYLKRFREWQRASQGHDV
jgi:flagellar biosynthesis protein FlhG